MHLLSGLGHLTRVAKRLGFSFVRKLRTWQWKLHAAYKYHRWETKKSLHAWRSIFSRFHFVGTITWSLEAREGWVRIHNFIIRWKHLPRAPQPVEDDNAI